MKKRTIAAVITTATVCVDAYIAGSAIGYIVDEHMDVDDDTKNITKLVACTVVGCALGSLGKMFLKKFN